MLACSLLERSDALRPRFRAAMSRCHTRPSWLWGLLADALSLEVAVAEEEEDGNSDEGLAFALGGTEVAAAAARLLSWSQPELVFKYLELHNNEVGIDLGVRPLARRWVLALLGLGSESMHELRCKTPQNRAHFERLASSGSCGEAAVEAWIAADLAGQSDDGAATDASSSSDSLPGVCDAMSLFMMGEELRTCMRIDKQCVRENAALLGYLTQGHVRLLSVRDDEVGAAGDESDPRKGRVAARATARLLGRADNSEPIVFIDQPLYGHHVSTGGTGDGGGADADAARKAELDELLLAQGMELGQRLGGVPVVGWASCVAPACDSAAAAEAPGGVPSARVEAATKEGRVALVEFDGLAPQTYCNLRGRLIRGTEAAMGRAPALREDAEAVTDDWKAAASEGSSERMAVYAFAAVEALFEP